MTYTSRKIKTAAVKYLSLFLCAVLMFFSCPLTTASATGAPLMYVNDIVFFDWEKTPSHTVDGVIYVPVTMFIDLDSVYYYSNPKSGTFYLQNEITEEYLSFSLKTSDAYNGKGMIHVDIQVFHDTIYLPAIETANHLGLYIEMNTDHTIVRLSDATAKMPFSKLIELYNPVIEPPTEPDTPPVITPPNTEDDPSVTVPPEGTVPNPEKDPVTEKPPEPVLIPCDFYMCFTDPENETLDSLITALKSKNIPTTFFMSAEYIKANPENVIKLHSHGYSIGIYCKNSSLTAPEDVLENILSANDALRRLTKQKTRIITLERDRRDLRDHLFQNGFSSHSFNITYPHNPKDSKAVASAVTSALPGVSQAKILMRSDVYSVSAIYEIGTFVNSHDIIKPYPIDETV